jgi:regulatory protein
MPVVTKLVTQKNGEYINLFVDDDFCCGISLNQVSEWKLYKGQIISAKQIDEICRQASQNRAYVAAIRYLSYRIRSSGEVRQYLRRRNLEEMAEYVIERLTSEKYLDDVEFTKSWLKMRCDMNWSLRAIKQDLVRKGIAHETIEKLVIDIDSEASIRYLIDKKNRYQKHDRDKMTKYLSGKGFDYEQIKKCLDEINTA